MLDAQAAAQIALEREALDLGKDRYLRQQDRVEGDQGFGSTDASVRVIQNYLTRASKVLRDDLRLKAQNSKAFQFLGLLDPDLLALIALRVCFNHIKIRTNLNAVVVDLGRYVENELWSQALKANDPKLYARLVTRATKTHGSIRHRKKAIRITAAKEGFAPLDWPADLKAAVGGPLLNCVLEGCPDVFETFITSNGKTTTRHIGLTDGAWELLEGLADSASWMAPLHTPMIVQPRPWVAFNTGCYLTPDTASTVPLVRSYDKDHIKTVKDAIADGSMAQCLEALNAIQDTQWAINGPLYDLVKWCWETGQSIDGFPSNSHLPRPDQPSQWETMNEDQRKAWRIKAAQIATRNRGIDSDRVTMLQDLRVAESLVSLPRFFIPHSLDFRGRVYAVPSFNGQRSDHIRALLQFSNGKPLGDEGAYWLAVHLANCGDFGGISKKSLDDRFSWTIEHEADIQQVASDPYATIDFWKQADKPFQFVAACMDYAAFLEVGYEHCSHLPIALDGSNSGLQHYSASLRSPEGSLVNLVPSDTPADLYQAVADIVTASVTEDAKGSGPQKSIAAMVLKNGITRKLVKRNAMTFSYSSGEYGMKKQHLTDLMHPLSLKVLEGALPEHPYGVDGGFKASGYIAKTTYKAITTLVKDATLGMKFFQDCAAALAHEGKGLSWITPIGLPVCHRYTEWDSKRVLMFLHDKKVPVLDTDQQITVDVEEGKKAVRLLIQTAQTKRINKAKAKSAVSPNVIHSLDASHLMLTVLKAKAQGITDFSLIHDSFGTHGTNTPEFFYIIREAFIEMYENYCPYETIYTETLAALDDKTKTPTTPIKGTLDVQSVYQSLYAFA